MVTFFTTGKAFVGHSGVIQRNALESWKRLGDGVEIIVFGDDEGAAEVCAELGLRHEPEVLRSASGAKRLDFMFRRAQEIARHEIVCYSNCDIIFTRELAEAARRVREWRCGKFLMVGRRWDTEVGESIDFARADWDREIVRRAKSEGVQRFYHNIDYFLFPRRMYAEVPPLVVGRVGWDHWVVGRAYAEGAAIVDASEAVCAVHQNHDYAYHPRGMEGVWNDEEARGNLELAVRGRGQRARTIEDAQWRLTRDGVVANRWHWLAPARRAVREAIRVRRGWWRTRVWHPLLDATRPLRHALGLKKAAVPRVLRSKKRIHSMD